MRAIDFAAREISNSLSLITKSNLITFYQDVKFLNKINMKDTGNNDESKKHTIQFIITRCQTAKVFQSQEKSPYFIAEFIKFPVITPQLKSNMLFTLQPGLKSSAQTQLRFPNTFISSANQRVDKECYNPPGTYLDF